MTSEQQQTPEYRLFISLQTEGAELHLDSLIEAREAYLESDAYIGGNSCDVLPRKHSLDLQINFWQKILALP